MLFIDHQPCCLATMLYFNLAVYRLPGTVCCFSTMLFFVYHVDRPFCLSTILCTHAVCQPCCLSPMLCSNHAPYQPFCLSTVFVPCGSSPYPLRSPDRFNAFAGALSRGGSVDDSLCDSSVRRYHFVHITDRSRS